MTRWGDIKRRVRSEWKGVKVVWKYRKTRELIASSYILYETSRCLYNPWHLLDLFVFPHLKKSITYNI